MNNDLLNSLYNELNALTERSTKVKELITLYGGKINESPSISLPINQNRDSEIGKIDISSVYPANKSWKDKILYVLKVLDRPVSTSEIVDYLHSDFEPEHTKEKISKAVSQYIWSMKKELNIDESGTKNKYSLKS